MRYAMLTSGVAMVTALLGACGQKGPLFLPDDTAPVLVTPVIPQAPATSPAATTVPPAKSQQDRSKPAK